MAKAKKTKKKTKITKNPKKASKRRGRPPGSARKRVLGGEKDREGFLNISEATSYEKNLSTDDFDTILIKQLKNNRKAKEKAFKDEYEDESEEEEDSDAYIEGYDIELPGGEEFEEDAMGISKKDKKKKRKNYFDEFGIDSEYYDSDYNIGEYE
ncbi:MAG: hypothetical protein HWN67_06280 [Candidatus Helarchaeota archaeon]|nr:hypothetical protein [Candidatus Helarchaeota archaeon]